MSRMMLTAGAMGLVSLYAVMTEGLQVRGGCLAARPRWMQASSAEVSSSAASGMKHFALRARTSTWDVALTCSGLDCRLRNSSHVFDHAVRNSVTIVTTYGGAL